MIKMKITVSEKVLKLLNDIITVNQSCKDKSNNDNDNDMDYSMHLYDIVRAYTNQIKYGCRIYDNEFTWNEIKYILATIQGTAFPDTDVKFIFDCFINEIEEYEVYFPDEASEFDVNAGQLVEKLIKGGEFACYALLALLHQALLNRRENPNYKEYIEQHVKLKVV